MEEKEDPAPKTTPGFQGKSGWMKKAHGRVLSSYKDRYVSVDKTEILIYENEDQKNLLERVDLENYDKCHEMKSSFKKKHRLILLRSPKSPNKVHDMKFQAKSSEDKEAWIKALSDAINRAKNKIFDEVKVDESSNLEHVTRTRPKGNRGRRPPTRIHMKEVADVSSDGILRLDLDLENAIMPNGTYSTSSTAVDGAESLKETTPSPSSSETFEEKPLSTIKEEEQDPNQTKVKPPMPPTKQATTIKEGLEEEEEPEKKTVKPPMTPSKDVEQSEKKTDKTPETSPNSKKKVPLMPPNKPLLSIIVPQDPSPSKTPVHPPTPPNKMKKPNASAETDQEATQNAENEESDNTEGEKDITKESEKIPITLENSPKQENRPELDVPNAIVEVEESKADISIVVVSLNDSENVSLSPFLAHIQAEDKEKKAEEKSVDSGQHSDDNSEDSASEGAPIDDSNSALDELESKDDSVNVPQIYPTKGYTSWVSKPPSPLKPKMKMQSVSSGNLLFDSCKNVGGDKSFESSKGDIEKLETEVAMQMEDTSELLSRTFQAQTVPKRDEDPENLLAEAMEKLKKADHVLREVKKLKLPKDASHRKSW